jgi:hypothetical protein
MVQMGMAENAPASFSLSKRLKFLHLLRIVGSNVSLIFSEIWRGGSLTPRPGCKSDQEPEALRMFVFLGYQIVGLPNDPAFNEHRLCWQVLTGGRCSSAPIARSMRVGFDLNRGVLLPKLRASK